MTIEEIELRKILTQMLADNGINRETIVPFVKDIIDKKIDAAIDRVINQTNLDEAVRKEIQKTISNQIGFAVKDKINRTFSNVNVTVEMNTSSKVESLTT